MVSRRLENMASLKNIVVLFCVFGFIGLSYEEDTCGAVNDDPREGIEEDPKGYPREEISKALENSEKLRSIINSDATSEAAFSKQEFIRTISPQSLCESKYITVKPHGWTYVDAKNVRCWVLHFWWTTPMSYVDCKPQKCKNVPCSYNHRCVPSNYKIYKAWSWCREGGFRLRKFQLPQCCECKLFVC